MNKDKKNSLRCGWSRSDDAPYETECGHAWEFTTGDVKENEVKFCPFCGRRIEEL